MLWEKIQSVEDDQLQDVENLSNVVDILGCLQEAHKLVLDIIIKQNETINLLSKEVNKLYNGIIFLTIWSLVLTILTVVISLNVFF
jgi:Mg2+ and Co2+ transporter CorA